MLWLCYFLLLCTGYIEAHFGIKKQYELTDEPLDVVIPTATKDIVTLELAIQGIKENCPEVRRIIVVSDKRLTECAEWVDEAIYPFSKKEIAHALSLGKAALREELLKPHSRCGWYYQQLLKLYAPFVIEDISSNVLIVDADTIFLNPVTFLTKKKGALFNATDKEAHLPYIIHAKKLIPNFTKLYAHLSGVTHHMLFQRPILADLFKCVEIAHRKEFWKAFCHTVDRLHLQRSGASEYEIYFNYALSCTDQVKIRKLDWKNITSLDQMLECQQKRLDYVSIHSWMLLP